MSDPLMPSSGGVWPPPPTQQPDTITNTFGLRNINQFRPQSLVNVIVFSLITLSLYTYVWIFRQIKVINRLLPENSIGMGWFISMFIINIVYYGLYFTFGNRDDASVGTLIYLIISLAAYILDLIVFFKIRNRLNILIGAKRGDWILFSGIWTFLFNILYLQHKINALIDVVE